MLVAKPVMAILTPKGKLGRGLEMDGHCVLRGALRNQSSEKEVEREKRETITLFPPSELQKWCLCTQTRDDPLFLFLAPRLFCL